MDGCWITQGLFAFSLYNISRLVLCGTEYPLCLIIFQWSHFHSHNKFNINSVYSKWWVLHHLVIQDIIYVPVAGFVIIPTPTIVEVGQVAEFQCQHTTADVIFWRLNGTHVTFKSGVTTSFTILPGGGILNKLTIEARPEYNTTSVECVALFIDGSPLVVTDTVVLTIQG